MKITSILNLNPFVADDNLSNLIIYCCVFSMIPSVNIIGAGRVGKTIGRLLVCNKLAKISAICNTSEKSTLDAIAFIGQGVLCLTLDNLPQAYITLITTPDDQISLVGKALSDNANLMQGGIVIHCSGSLSSDVLLPLKEKGCYIASIHPMRSFANPEFSVLDYQETYCAIEGDEEAKRVASVLFGAFGSSIYEIDKTKKSLYHIAGVFASNYLVTLSQQALSCMKEAGVDEEIAMKVITSIMQVTVSNLEQTSSPQLALTGPIKRGDISTIQKHIDSLFHPQQQHLYKTLAKATLALSTVDETKKEQIESILEDACSKV